MGTIRDLGLPGRAVTALTRAGITRVEDLAVLTDRDLAAISGLGTGMIAAIRLVVPEPPTGAARSGIPPEAGHDEPGPAEEEAPVAPEIPSFASLRDPRRRAPVDVLLSQSTYGPAASGPAPAAAPRPAEYADLLRLGARVIRAVAALPWRVARWSVREPVRCVGRLPAAVSARLR